MLGLRYFIKCALLVWRNIITPSREQLWTKDGGCQDWHLLFSTSNGCV